MITPPTPANEADRLAALHGLRILDTPHEERFDRVTRLARYVFDAPITLVGGLEKITGWRGRSGEVSSAAADSATWSI